MSGARSVSHATAASVRCLTELTFHVAMRMARSARWCNLAAQCPRRRRPGRPGWAGRIKFKLNPGMQPPEGCTEFTNMLGQTGVSKRCSATRRYKQNRTGAEWEFMAVSQDAEV